MATRKYSPPYPRTVRAEKRDAPFHSERDDLRHCIDLAMRPGAPILASRGGIVVMRESRFAKNYRDKESAARCNMVVIRHADGEESVYVHLAWRSVTVRCGQPVRRGQRIGLCGQTGYSTYPHLHFGVYDRLGKNLPVVFRRRSA